MPDKGTTDAIFVVKQLHEKLTAKSKVYFGFVDLKWASQCTKGSDILSYA